MPATGAALEFVLTLRHTADGAPCGTLRVVGHEEIPDLDATKDGMLAYFGQVLAAFPDLRMDVEDLLVDGDKTVARVRATATHDGEFMGVPPTGKRASLQLIDIMRFNADGLVCEHWGVADFLSLMQQLGAVPA